MNNLQIGPPAEPNPQAPIIDLFEWATSHRLKYDRKLETAYTLEDHRRANKLFAVTYKMQELHTKSAFMNQQLEESGVA